MVTMAVKQQEEQQNKKYKKTYEKESVYKKEHGILHIASITQHDFVQKEKQKKVCKGISKRSQRDVINAKKEFGKWLRPIKFPKVRSSKATNSASRVSTK